MGDQRSKAPLTAVARVLVLLYHASDCLNRHTRMSGGTDKYPLTQAASRSEYGRPMLEVIGAALSEAVRNIRAAEDYNARDAVRLMAILRGALRSFLLYQLDTGAMKYIRSGYNSQADYRTFRSIPFTYSRA